MMSVPAINSVLPPSGSQPAKISSSPTASPSAIGISVPPKLSVIPPSQIPTSPSKPPIYSEVPLSLVYENKVTGTQNVKSPSDKPKDLSPPKPTPNGVEASTVKTSPQTQQPQLSPNSKVEEATPQQTTTNHTEERIPQSGSEEPAQNTNSEPQNAAPEKVEPSSNQNISKEEEVKEGEKNEEASEDKTTITTTTAAAGTTTTSATESTTTTTTTITTTTGSEGEKTEEKTSPPAQSSKRKREQKPQEKKEDEPEPEKKPRRIRSQVLPYQSPLPELATFINKSLKEKDASQKNNEEKLIVFYRNEFLAVRNAEGGFYLCQTLQNVYRSSHRIRIRWLSQKKEESTEDGDIYTPDFYDLTDFECILTTVALSKRDKNMYKLPKVELERIENILKRALDVEKGVTEKPPITEEHPDGIDLSLYKDESQLQKPKKAGKRKASSPARKSPKQARKAEPTETEGKPQPATKKPTTTRSRRKAGKKAGKSPAAKGGKKSGGRSESVKSKVDQLKVSPPNEKARVVAKVLRKVDIVPAKEGSAKKQAKSKGGKRGQEAAPRSQKKKGQKSGVGGKGAGKEEPSGSHHERRQGKKHPNNKNKK